MPGPASADSRRQPFPHGLALAAALALGGGIRLGLALRDIVAVDDLFVPDDSYYTLAIARSLAAGHGPTVDGTVLTNGFQPLLAFLLVPFFWLVRNPDAGLRAAVLLGALADVATIALLARLGSRLRSPTLGLLAAAFWAASPLAVANALNGLETSLSVACVVAALSAWAGLDEAAPPRRFLGLGLLWGLALLARVDTAFAVLPFGLALLARREWRRLCAAATAALAVVLPWWAYSTVVFGTPVPESGPAVRQYALLHRELYLTTQGQLAAALGTLLPTPFVHSRALREMVFESSAWAGLGTAAYAALVAAVGLVLDRSYRRDGSRAPVLPVLLAWGGAILAFYVFVVPAAWFFPRYLLPCALVAGLLAAGALASGLERARAPWARGGLALLACVLLVPGLLSAWDLLRVETTGTLDAGLHGAKGYRRAAQEILAAVPAGSVVGAMQTGALTYFAPPGVRVVNLDGVVDGFAARALRERRLAGYARARGVTHLADWPFNIENFARRAGPAASGLRARELARASPQGHESTVLLALEWPPPLPQPGPR